MRRLIILLVATLAVAVREIADEDIHKYTFEDYIQDWGKSYPSHLEYNIHKNLFEIRKQQIIRQNSDSKATWRAGFNQFSDMSDFEFKAYRGYDSRMGFVMKDEAIHVETPKPVSGALPPSWDWRTVPGVLTPVKNQGQCGSCWAFSATESIESAYALAMNLTAPILSPQDVVSCTPNPQQCGGTGGCGGATAELAIQYVASAGIYYNTEWPYTGTTGTCAPPTGEEPAVTVSGYVKLISNNYTDLIYNVLNTPISVSVDASSWNLYKGGVYTCPTPNGTLDIDHAVQLVGYGTDPNAGDYWIVRNSWGATWGEGGYIRLKRYSDGSSAWCWPDPTPQDGSGCLGGPSVVTVCGDCGIWYDSCYPVGAKNY
jgi:cathepsin L